MATGDRRPPAAKAGQNGSIEPSGTPSGASDARQESHDAAVAPHRVTSAHRFEAMFHEHQAVMLLIDPVTGQIVDANPSAAAFYGYSVPKLRAMPITSINTMPVDEVADPLAQARAGGQGHFVCPHRLASGEVRRVDVHTTPIGDEQPLLFSIIIDIEERVRAEERLARVSEYSRTLIEASLDPLVTISTQGVITDVNTATENATGIARQSLIGSDFANSFTDPDKARTGYQQAFTHGSVTDFPLAIRNTDGTVTDVLYNGTVYRDVSGGVAGVVAVARDITERKRAAEALAASEEESRLAFDRSRVATCLVANDGRLLRVNPAICDLMGRTEAELLSLGFLDLTHPDDVAVGADLLRDLVAGNRPSLRLTKRYVTGDGRAIWGDVTVSSVLDAEGNVRHRIAQILDVTKEHTLHQSLLEAERIAHLGSWQLNVATGVVAWSPELFGMFDLDPKGPVPNYHEQEGLFTPESWRRLSAAVSEAQSTGAPYELELQTTRADGTHGWMQARGEAIRDAKGSIVELHGVSLDITDRKRAEQELASSEQLLRAVLDSSRDTAIRVGNDDSVEYVNQRVVEISGMPSERWIGSTFAEMGYPAELAQSWSAHRAIVIATGKPVTHEFEIDNAEGHRWYEATVAPEFDSDGAVTHVIETSRDITDRKIADAELRSSRAQLEQAQRLAHVGNWTLDNATNHVTWSEELFLMQGLDPQGSVPDYTEHGRLFSPESWQELSRALALTQETGVPHELELEMVRPDGTHGWMLARGEAVRDARGAIIGLQGVALDITERKNASDVLQVMATHDPLTGLANRAALVDEISRALSAGRRSRRSTAVLMMDLDRFKGVNDTLGHAAGDDLLIAAGARIEKAMRAGDLVARLGGDEFVIVMRDLDGTAEAAGAAARLVEVFRESFTVGGAEVYSTASVGVAIAAEDVDAGDVLREADTAMYAAKDQGRDRVAMFNEDLRTVVSTRLAVETDLRHALDRGQLAVWYQPEVDLATGAVVAVEALLRWHHPDGNLKSADQFIDVAEETGLILDIGDWVLRQACGQAAAWATDRPDRPITVRVNLSALQLTENGLLEALDDALNATGLDPTLLCLEITETSLIRETTNARANLVGIHDRGIALAIDDFGTGFASLTYLSRFPIDVIKIDRTFITDATSPNHDHRLVAGIIALATTLGITVTAEGVEQREQAAHLREMGCPSAQGWLYSPAVPADQITPLLDHTYR
jgi:diguanylate cyclase (GGDEF)-like protein/PAS domain S-box-containing protein